MRSKINVYTSFVFMNMLLSLALCDFNVEAQQSIAPLKNAHAHNDYRHDRPFWDAYENGFCSLEADIFRVEDELYVAHDVLELTKKRKLVDLYLKPLFSEIQKNGGSLYANQKQPIILLIDIKADGRKVFPLLKKTLAPFRSMLCCVENGVYKKRAVQIVISGDRPRQLIEQDADQLMSLDGRLSDLDSELSVVTLPLISDRWGSHFRWKGLGAMPENEQRKLRKLVNAAHASSRKIRFWATPETPAAWKELADAGVDLINTDDLTGLREFLLAQPPRSMAEPQGSGDVVTRIGMIGCHRQDKPAPAFNRYIQAVPDIAVWMGDNVYGDTKDDINYLKACYDRLASQTAFQKLKELVPFVVTWDDHDYGLNNFGKNYKLKDESRKYFRKFWNMEEHIPADRDGIYHARYFNSKEKQLQMIMLDTRYNRDDEGDESDTLGEAQWRWLEAELKKPAKLRLIASGYQVLLDRKQKFETWSKFPAAKKRLFELIKKCKAEGVIFLAGDQHYGEVSRDAGAIGYDAIEFMFSGINQEEPHVFNSYRVSPVAHALNSYALIDIQWEQNEIDVPHVTFRCFDADTNRPELTYRVNFSELMNR